MCNNFEFIEDADEAQEILDEKLQQEAQNAFINDYND